MRTVGQVAMTIDGLMYESAASDMLFDLGDRRKVLVLPLAEDMTTEGAMLLAARIRERFPGCFMEFPQDDPPGDEEPDAVPGLRAA